VVVLSHHHGDHFDHRAADGLPKDVPIVTTQHAARKLAKQGFTNARPLETWGHQDLRRGDRTLRVTATPGRHAPGLLDAAMPPVMGSVLEFGDASAADLRIYVTGDTLIHDRLRDIPRRYPDLHLALLHLGGTRLFGVTLTMDAAQGVEALRIVGPRHAVPIHYDDYTVFKSPLSDFRAQVDAADDLQTVVHYLDRGESLRFSAADLTG
jgi:L-ascorbate metabolism protein UlaG (beta-lactamase superfamily)